MLSRMAGIVGSGHHGPGIGQAGGHGFFHQHMLTMLGAQQHLAGMPFGGGGQIHRIQSRLTKQGCQAVVHRHTTLLVGTFAQTGHGLGNARQTETGMLVDGGQKGLARRAKTGQPDAHQRFVCHWATLPRA